MSNNPGGKTISFISGILIGVIVCLGLFFLVMIGFNPISFFNDSETSQTLDTVVDLRNKSGELVVKHPKQQSQIISVDNSELILDSLPTEIQLDSTSETNNPIDENNLEEIVVKRDVLIETRTLRLIALNRNSGKGKVDSLISIFQGSNSQTLEYRLEFWQSPVNYRGFKFIRNAIVTFGLDPNESSKLFQQDDKFYLKQGSIVYRLSTTEKFEPLTKVTDENLIKQIR